ncbi:RNA polymerase sigma factor sigF, chloroplastic-like [Impatiens glandulifera]|uniref:RNA polymerase sigma factor sigF, chloroplastic-like n=1 Tax=Impatiens glandulifera TaxID=253017 RepID=UPI001FB0E7BC|nr:RNA polymerase sigma factor sigF, chloroplastic-like [Impatiens glandulifera]
MNPLMVAKALGGKLTCFERDWLRKNLNVIGIGLIGWLAPSKSNETRKVKTRLHTQFGREPTLVEWEEATSRELKSRLNFYNRSRERLISVNLRMVIHIAKQYQNHGLKLHDLLQEGSMVLLKSVEKFKPQAGCRFATYAYWWIRQSIRKAIFQHSRTIPFQ